MNASFMTMTTKRMRIYSEKEIYVSRFDLIIRNGLSNAFNDIRYICKINEGNNNNKHLLKFIKL